MFAPNTVTYPAFNIMMSHQHQFYPNHNVINYILTGEIYTIELNAIKCDSFNNQDGLDAATLAEKHGREDLAAVLRSVQMELNMNKLGSIEEGPEESKESEMKEEESAEKKQAENGPQKDGTKEKKEEEVERVEKNNDKNDSEEDGKGPAEEDKGEGPHEEQK